MGCGSEDNFCPQCFMCPCVVLKPPDFLRGSSDAHIRNRQHRFRLYRGFWKMLKDLCVWNDNRYLERKKRVTQEHDQREIMPSCVVDVCVLYYNTTVHVHVYNKMYNSYRRLEDATQIHLGYLTLTMYPPGQLTITELIL